MNLTPLEIRKQEFERVFRGFNPEEVQRFLATIASEWESRLDDQRRLEAQIVELQSKIEHYQKVEEALQEALNTARENAVRTTRQAKEKADLILEKAELKAHQLVEQADSKARSILDEADNKRRSVEDDARTTVEDTEGEKRQLKQEVTRLFDHRSEILSRLRGFLLSEMEVLARYEEDDPIGFIKLLPPDAGRGSAPEKPATEQETGETFDPASAEETAMDDSSDEVPGDSPADDEIVSEEADQASEELDVLPLEEEVAESSEMEPDDEAGDDSGEGEDGHMTEIVEDDIDVGLFVGKDMFEPIDPGSETEMENSGAGKTPVQNANSEEVGDKTEDDSEDSEEMKKIRRILRELS